MTHSTRIPALSVALLVPAALCACASAPAIPPTPCVDACITHTEGYEWAQRGDYADPAVCRGYPPAFADGCRDGIEDRNQLRRVSRGF